MSRREWDVCFVCGRDRLETREGLVMVYDDEGRYLGCMGRERWERLLVEDEPATRLGPDELPRIREEP